MTTTAIDPCRVSVRGPAGRIDLAVPPDTTVAALLPLLVARLVAVAGTQHEPDDGRGWVLQRLGEAPMDPDASASSLDLLDGEELHLTLAEDPLPELDFDDVADGIATVVSRRKDRWNDRIKRAVFLSVATAMVALAATMLLLDGSSLLPAATLAALGVGFATAAVFRARWAPDRVVPGLAAAVGVLLVGLAVGTALLGGRGVLAGGTDAALVVGGGIAVAAGALLGFRATLAHSLPLEPLGVLAALGLAAAWGSRYVVEPGPPHTPAALALTVLIIVLVYAPRIATRGARLRGPQLPRRSEELGVDVEPAPADLVVRRTARADAYLTVLAMASGIAVLPCVVALLTSPTWQNRLVVALTCLLLLARAREFLNAVQRTSLMVSGVLVGAWLVRTMTAEAATARVVLVALGLVTGAVLLAISAHRPVHRRALPIWAHLVDVFEMLGAVLLVPFVLQVTGVLAWARGLAG